MSLSDDLREIRTSLAKQENTLTRMEEHLANMNGAVAKNITFREAHPEVCEKVRKELWQAITRNRIAVAVLIVSAGGGTGIWALLKYVIN